MDKPWDLRERTMQFSVNVFAFCRALPQSDDTRDVAGQLRRAAASVGANYRAVKRAKSSRDFANKPGTVIEEADECDFWLELLARVNAVEPRLTHDLRQEAGELVAIFTSSQKTARAKRGTPKDKPL